MTTTNRISPLVAAKSIIKTHPKKTAGGCALAAAILTMIGQGRPLCALIPPPGNAICMAVTMGAETTGTILDKSNVDTTTLETENVPVTP